MRVQKASPCSSKLRSDPARASTAGHATLGLQPLCPWAHHPLPIWAPTRIPPTLAGEHTGCDWQDETWCTPLLLAPS
eukprot:scaffold10688_cov15-Tisochrysis_lutea.AAC.1